MDLIENKSTDDLIKSTLAEIAKAQNEIRCAKGDIDKAHSRLGFLILVINELLARSSKID